MKRKISFKKMLDISSEKPKKVKKHEIPSHDGEITKEIIGEKVEKRDLANKTPTKEEKDEKRVGYKKIVLFRLSNEYYGIDVSMIDEITDTEVKEKIAGMPYFIVGVIYLRGESVPVLSLFDRFHLKGRPIKEAETILITSKNNETYGILIDELKGVIDIEQSSIFDVPMIYPDDEFSYLKGIIKFGEEIAAIVDIKQILKKYKLG
ncbi:hypothetical protein ES703_01472 [subsurface metagenome]